MTTFEISTLILSSIGLVFVGFQLWSISHTVKLDNGRNKNQATVEVAAKEFRQARLIIQKYTGMKKLTAEDLQNLVNNNENFAEFNEAFGTLEHISVALHYNIYNKSLFFDMFGSTCVEIFNNNALYIKHRQDVHGIRTYAQLKQLVKEVEVMLKKQSRKTSAINKPS